MRHRDSTPFFGVDDSILVVQQEGFEKAFRFQITYVFSHPMPRILQGDNQIVRLSLYFWGDRKMRRKDSLKELLKNRMKRLR